MTLPHMYEPYYLIDPARGESFPMPSSKPLEDNYEVVKPFTIADIYDKRPCRDEFSKLLKEVRHTVCKFKTIDKIKNYPTLTRNFAWLIDKGFVQAKKPVEWYVNVYLKPDNTVRVSSKFNNETACRSKAYELAQPGERIIETIKLN